MGSLFLIKKEKKYRIENKQMVKRILKKTKDIFFANPRLLYDNEKHLLNKPFYYEGDNGEAILLLHGWTSVPYELRRLGEYLNQNGYTVHIPMLRGHGTVPKDLEGVKWSDWLDDAERDYLKLKEKYNKVYVGGTSIGSSLAVILAEKYPEISGLILLAMPYKFILERFVIIYGKSIGVLKKYNNKIYPPTFGLSTSITRIISYQSYPFESALQAFELVKKSRDSIPMVTQPCFLMQSSHDHMTVKNNMEKIYNQVKSKIKVKKYIERAYHTFISDIKNEHIFEEILNFIKTL